MLHDPLSPAQKSTAIHEVEPLWSMTPGRKVMAGSRFKVSGSGILGLQTTVLGLGFWYC